MSWVVTAVVGGSLASGYLSSEATSEAGSQTAAATAAATAETGRQFDVAQENLAPYRELGTEFLPMLREFMRGNYDDFLESPDYAFTKEQGEQALDRKASAAGSRYGGRALKEAVNFGQGLASTQIDKFFNRVFNVVGMGQSAAAGTAQAALQTGQTNAGLIANQGNTQANLTMQNAMNTSNAITSGVGNLTTLSMYNNMMNRVPVA